MEVSPSLGDMVWLKHVRESIYFLVNLIKVMEEPMSVLLQIFLERLLWPLAL